MTNQTTPLATDQPSGATPTTDSPVAPTWLRQLLTMAHCEYRQAIRNRWAVAVVGIFAVFGAILVTFSGSAVGPEGVERIIASLTTLSVYLVPLVALVFGYDALVSRRQRGWLQLVFSLPVPRWRVVLGSYLGRAAILAAATVLGFGFVGLMVAHHHGTAHWQSFLVFLTSSVAVGVVFLAMAFVVSSFAREKTHALGLVLLLWVWFVFAHDLLALGAVAAFELSQSAVTALVVANPASTFRVIVLEQLGTTAGGGFTAAFAAAELSTGLLLASLAGWAVVAVAAAALFAGVDSRTTIRRFTARFRRLAGAGVVLGCVLFAAGCLDSDDTESTAPDPTPISLDDSRTCDVCGMVIEGAGEYGPNAQVFFDGDIPAQRDGPAHYDSVREMFVDVFSHKRRGVDPVAIFVTDYATVDYRIERRRGDHYITGSLRADTFVDADDAFFVVHSGIRGAMGDELLPFSTRTEAVEFIKEHGGELVARDEITAKFVNSI